MNDIFRKENNGSNATATGSTAPDVYFRHDAWVQRVTKGKLNDYTFMTVEESDYLYHFALQYIPAYLEELEQKKKKETSKLEEWDDLEVEGAVPWTYTAEFSGFGYQGPEDEEEEAETETEKETKKEGKKDIEEKKKKEGEKEKEKEKEVKSEATAEQTADKAETAKADDSSQPDGKLKKKKKKNTLTKFKSGMGEFVLRFKTFKVYVIHKEISAIASNNRPYRIMVFFIHGKNNTKPLKEFAEFLATQNKQDTVTRDYISVYRYNIQNNYWQSAYNARARPERSVVLPKATKKRLLEDVKDFVDKDTKKWYFEKGIPYKRSYLFYGVPGSGKTSIISVLAGTYNKPVCYLAPTHPMMNDEALKSAIISAPEGGIIIFEDVDGLFSKDRKSTVRNHLTFSGLLNALDGVGSGFGQIFILTTNFRDRLDSALIRNGRVDLQIEFKHVVAEQVEEMFGLFYEKADEKARAHFRERVFELLATVTDKPCLSAAMLQNFFITHRKCTFAEAIDSTEDLIEDVKNVLVDNANREKDRKEAEVNDRKGQQAQQGQQAQSAAQGGLGRMHLLLRKGLEGAMGSGQDPAQVLDM